MEEPRPKFYRLFQGHSEHTTSVGNFVTFPHQFIAVFRQKKICDNKNCLSRTYHVTNNKNGGHTKKSVTESVRDDD